MLKETFLVICTEFPTELRQNKQAWPTLREELLEKNTL